MGEAAVVQMLVSGQNDLYWFDSNLSKLEKEYNNKFIAFQEKKVIDSDSNMDNLMKKLKKKDIDISSIFIKFISKIKSIL